MRAVTDEDLPLQCLYRWEIERSTSIFLTQPHSGGCVREWTWAQAAGEIRRMAAFLNSMAWEPGTRVGIVSKNCAWWVMADLAIWMAGHVSVPVYPSLKAQSIRQILEHSEAKACFLGATEQKDIAESAIPPGVECIAFPRLDKPGLHNWEDILATAVPVEGRPEREANDLATIIYTSGTTGMPKGVMHTFAAFSFDAVSLAHRLGMAEAQRVVSYLPLAHIVERVGVEFFGLILGSHLFFTEGPEAFLTDLRKARPTIFLAVPRVLMKFQQGVFDRISRSSLDRLMSFGAIRGFLGRRILRQLGLDAVHFAACGAAPLPPEVLKWYRDLGLNLGEGFGMTETLITHLPELGAVRPGYVGSAIAGVEARLSENGEVLLRSPMNMLGYYKDPAGTLSAFLPDGFIRTGDLGVIEPDGQLRIVGRIKEQFKTSKGKYVAPAPIESKLITHPDVESCCLMGAGRQCPFAVVILSESARKRCTSPADREAIERSLHTRLDEVNAELEAHEKVGFIAIVDGPWTVFNGYITPTLKLRRNAVESHYRQLADDWNRRHAAVVWESIPAIAPAVSHPVH